MNHAARDFVSQGRGRRGKVTRFGIVGCELDPARERVRLTLALEWEIAETGGPPAAPSSWRASLVVPDPSGAVITLATADVEPEHVLPLAAAGRLLRFAVRVTVQVPARLASRIEATIRQPPNGPRSPQGDMLGFADAPRAERDTAEDFGSTELRWLADHGLLTEDEDQPASAGYAGPTDGSQELSMGSEFFSLGGDIDKLEAAGPDRPDSSLEEPRPAAAPERCGAAQPPDEILGREPAQPSPASYGAANGGWPPPLPARTAPSAPGDPRGDAAVFCPPAVARGTSFLVQVLLYQSERADDARAQAREADAAAERRGVLALPPDLPAGTRLDLHLEMPALLVEEPDAALVWTGATTAAQFEVSVPQGAALGNAIGRVRFSIAGVPSGTLRFQLGVVADTAAVETKASDRPLEVLRYRRAFVSYSSSDRAEVLRRVQAFRIAGLSVFQDVLDLEPGERWERELYKEIDRADVFLLFWSRAAAASPWVAKEIDYALARRQGRDDAPPEIAPVPIEGPPIAPPPERLKHLHFNDALLAHIAAAVCSGRWRS